MYNSFIEELLYLFARFKAYPGYTVQEAADKAWELMLPTKYNKSDNIITPLKYQIIKHTVPYF